MLLRKIELLAKILWLKYRYPRTLSHLRKSFGKRKMKVGFMVSEVAKWKGQALYDLMSENPSYDPVILVYPNSHDSLQRQRGAAAYIEDYFSAKGMEVRNVWNYSQGRWNHETVSDIDLCFYQQPWDIPQTLYPHQVASRTLTFYFPYYLGSYVDPNGVGRRLHYEVFRHIIPDKKTFEAYSAKRPWWKFAGELIVLGHPFLDLLTRDNLHRRPGRYVIYAPHFSFPLKGGKRIFPASTFLDNGLLILDFARQHPELQWVFKPHPLLRQELIDTGTWTEKAVNDYYSAWEEIGKACYTSDYVDLFADSRVLITDCGSFLTEYSCTGNPIIHLIPGKLPLSPRPDMEELFERFYRVSDVGTLQQVLNSVVLEGKDPRRKERMQCLDRLGLRDSHAAEDIVEYIDKLLG